MKKYCQCWNECQQEAEINNFCRECHEAGCTTIEEFIESKKDLTPEEIEAIEDYKEKKTWAEIGKRARIQWIKENPY